MHPPTPSRRLGIPTTADDDAALAAALYRGVLHTLPASARGWLNEVRLRARAAAVEAYTATHESPSLLASEFAAVQASAVEMSGQSRVAHAEPPYSTSLRHHMHPLLSLL